MLTIFAIVARLSENLFCRKWGLFSLEGIGRVAARDLMIDWLYLQFLMCVDPCMVWWRLRSLSFSRA